VDIFDPTQLAQMAKIATLESRKGVIQFEQIITYFCDEFVQIVLCLFEFLAHLGRFLRFSQPPLEF